MAYATVKQLAAEAKVSGGFSVNTSPDATKAQEVLDEVEALVNARIANKYRTPVTQAANVALVRGLVLALAVERVREIMTVKAGATSVEQQAAKTTADQARKSLQMIIDGGLTLAGEVLADSPNDGVRSYALSNGQKPVFKKGCEQW